ncbi:MAG: SurA N-terminal domain-containing protein [Coriobacteriaceae bacterium]|nr:SurA N-terminal domain-containing protein [Coriobacteriaceae bacterium]
MLSWCKRLGVAACACTVLLLPCAALTGCGEKIAADVNGTQIEEETITNYIENEMATDGYDEDEEGWETYLVDREYDEDADEEEADEEDTDSEDADVEDDEAEDESETTEDLHQAALDYRTYVIDQFIETELIQQDVKDKGVTVTDEEVDEYADEIEYYYEYYYAGGMAGTAESILQLMGYKDLDAFKDECRTELEIEALQKMMCPVESDEEDADSDEEAADEGEDADSSDESDDEEEATDEEDAADEEETDEEYDEEAWDAYVEQLRADANVTVNDPPENLSYDPTVINANGGFVSTEDAAEESQDEADEDADVDAVEESTEDEDVSEDEGVDVDDLDEDAVYTIDEDGNLVLDDEEADSEDSSK